MGLFERIRAMQEMRNITGKGGVNIGMPVVLTKVEEDLRAELTSLRDSDTECDVPVRYFLHWSGEVQGVGFRWTHQRYANERHLTGWVKNMDDGTVEMEIQGLPQLLLAHLEKIHADYARMFTSIKMTEAKPLPVKPNESDFKVKY